jgi:anaerobic magnesium-protoporphyrin IX monomethyl ester cyclase
MMVALMVSVLLLNLPSPYGQYLWRDTAGGFGTSISHSPDYSLTGETTLHPFFPYAASVLKNAGIEFKIIDGQRLHLTTDQVFEILKRLNPDIIFSLISLPSMKNDLEILGMIKGHLENVKTVGIGTVCRVLPDEVLSTRRIDVLLRNSYPYVQGIVELVHALMGFGSLKGLSGISYIEHEQPIHNAEVAELNLSDLPDPDYSEIPLDGYELYSDSSRKLPYVLVLESKGCPYGCIYCPYPLGYGRQLTYRPASKIVEEIEYLHHNRGIKVFAFKGQSFAYDKKHSIEICDELLKRKLDITWFCESRVDEVDRSLLEKMMIAGCRRIHFGVETGDAETIKIAKPGVTLEKTKKAFSLTKRYGFSTQAHIVLGWPDDTILTLKKTRKFLLDIKPDVLNLNFLTPYPGTKIREIAQRNSLILTNDWSRYTSHNVVMRTKNLNAKQIYSAKNKIVRDFSVNKFENLIFRMKLDIFKDPKFFLSESKILFNRMLFPEID